MVESADEPPLRGLHSWAKSKTLTSFNPFRSSKHPPPSPADTLPQHVGHPDPGRAAGSTTDPALNHVENTQPQGAPVVDKEGNGEESSTIAPQQEKKKQKAPVKQRFMRDVKRIITASWVNWLLIFVPVGIILGAVSDWGGQDIVSPSVIFGLNAVAIIPLASLLAYATESVAIRLGDTIGALMNVTFGNAVEIIIFVIGLSANQVRIVQAAAIGSILSNLLLILGMSFVFGGLRFREQLYNPSVSQMSACLLSLSVISLLLPTAFHAAFADDDVADRVVLQVSRGSSVVLLLVYILYLLFQLKSHAFMYQSTPQHIIDEESHPGVLAEMLQHSSSSSSDSSSSSSADSDTTHSSHKTSKRIKRALRRKRRKSVTKENISLTSGLRSRTDVTVTASTQPAHDGVSSGDEADGEGRRRTRRESNHDIHARDFETESAVRKEIKKAKKAKKRKHRSRESLHKKTNDVAAEKVPTPQIQVGFVDDTEEIPNDPAARRPFDLRHLSGAVKPAFNSTVFPHHEALGRSLAIPAVRSYEPTSGSSSRRASSMPDIYRRSSPMPRAASPRPPLIPHNQAAEAQAEATVEPMQHLSKKSAIVLLIMTTAMVALCAEFLVGSIDYLVSTSGVSQAFIGLIILPIVGNAAEHVTAVTVAYKNKMDLAINIALGSSIQIALFVTPLMVMLGWAIGTEMSLYFSLFETMSLFASCFIVNYLIIDGRSNYLEGTLLIAAYIIIAISAFFYPQCGLSPAGGPTDGTRAC